MFHFPYLQSLVKKNEYYRPHFKNLESIKVQLLSQIKSNSNSASFSTTKTELERNKTISSPVRIRQFPSDACNLVKVGHIHWKKLFQARFQSDTRSRLGEMKEENDPETLPRALGINNPSGFIGGSMITPWLGPFNGINLNWKLLHQQLHGIDENVSTFDYCYIPFFDEPLQFEKNKKKEEQVNCSLCQRWFGGVSEKVEFYLEELKRKEKHQSDKSSSQQRKSKLMTRRVCELCSKILSNRKGLERHMLIHTGEKPFPCDICGKPFRRKDNCARHKKTAHLFKKPRKPRKRRFQNATAPQIQ